MLEIVKEEAKTKEEALENILKDEENKCKVLGTNK